MAKKRWEGKIVKDLRSVGSGANGLPPEHKKGDSVICRKQRTVDDEYGSWDGTYEYHYTDMNDYNLVRTSEFLIEGSKEENKRLLEILLKRVKEAKDFKSMCLLLNDLEKDKTINNAEMYILRNYITNNCNTKYRKQGKYEIFGYKVCYYYWESGIKKPRITWLKYHINKNK